MHQMILGYLILTDFFFCGQIIAHRFATPTCVPHVSHLTQRKAPDIYSQSPAKVILVSDDKPETNSPDVNKW